MFKVDSFDLYFHQALSIAKETYLRVNAEGILCVQHQVNVTLILFLIYQDTNPKSIYCRLNRRKVESTPTLILSWSLRIEAVKMTEHRVRQMTFVSDLSCGNYWKERRHDLFCALEDLKS